MSTLLDDLRPVAFSVAYRMLGSVSEAEDVVQETLLRVHATLEEGERIESPRAYAATVATRLSIDALRSARRRRETYVGEWLPEPIVTGVDDDPALHAELSDSLSLAFLVLLESLSPEQRAVFLLREVFDVITSPSHSINKAGHPMLVTDNQLPLGVFIALLRPSHEVSQCVR